MVKEGSGVCRLCGTRFLRRTAWQEVCSKRCRLIEWALKQPEAKHRLK